MRHYIAAVLAVAFWCAVPGLLSVSAQQVNSFEQLQLLVKPGDKVEVIGADGVSTKGRIESLTPTSLRLAIKGSARIYAQKDAFEIKQRRSDPLANGAWIGAISGGGLAGLGVIAVCSIDGCAGDGGELAAAVVVYTGLGVAIGVGIDAMFSHRQTIYRQLPQTGLRSLTVAPLLASDRKGISMKVSF